MNKKLVVEILIIFACIFLLSVGTAFAPCYPPNNNPFCEGNLDYDCDVDGSDAAMFKTDFGRSGFSSPCSPAGPAQVARTGQVSSWFPYDDGSLQCGVASPAPRFTDNGDGTVTDNLTGLIWLKDAGCLTANQTCAVAMVECWILNSGECGLTDGSIEGEWRLPTVREMYSLLDYGRKRPALTPGMFTNQDIWVYCSSTPTINDKDYLWCVNTEFGTVEYYIGSNWFGALCVKTTHPYCPVTVTTVPTTTSTSTIPPTGVHISHWDSNNGDLKYAYWNGSSWDKETVDTGSISFPSLAIDSSGNPHISYHDVTNGDLKYAWCYWNIWTTQTVDDTASDAGHSTSIAIDSNGNPHISYVVIEEAEPWPCLKLAYWIGSGWSRETVSCVIGSPGSTSLALDSTNDQHIAFKGGSGVYKIFYAFWNVSSWSIEQVDHSCDGYGCESPSLALDSNDNPHITYYVDNLLNGDLKYARWNGSSWVLETVDNAGYVGRYSSLALNSNGNPHISYYDSTNGDLKYAWYDGTWHTETVDSAGDVGLFTSLALDSSDNPHISYRDVTNSYLKYAHWNGSSWSIETVDSDGNVGWSTSIAVK